MEQKVKPYVFVSAAERDLGKTLSLIEGLERQGMRVVSDIDLNYSAEFADEVAKYIDDSGAVLVLLSSAALTSQDVRRVITYCINTDKAIKAVYLEQVDLTPGMKLQLCLIPAISRGDYSSMSDLISLLCADKMFAGCFGGGDISSDRRVAIPRSIGKYDTVVFGNYGDDGDARPLEWTVIDKSGNRLLLFSKYVVDEKTYHSVETEIVPWSDSFIRHWLNGEFCKKAFTKRESAYMLDMPVIKQSATKKESLSSFDRVRLLTGEELAVILREQPDLAKGELPPHKQHLQGYDEPWLAIAENRRGDEVYFSEEISYGQPGEMSGQFYKSGIRPVIAITTEEL